MNIEQFLKTADRDNTPTVTIGFRSLYWDGSKWSVDAYGATIKRFESFKLAMKFIEKGRMIRDAICHVYFSPTM